MKKISKFIATLSILAAIFLMVGCGVKDLVKYDTWYKYNKEGGLDIPIGAYGTGDSETAAGQLMENAELYVYYNKTDGLKLAIQSTKTQNIEIAGGLLSTSVDIVTGATKDYPTSEFGTGRWSALVLSGNFTECSTPKIVAHPEQCIDLSNSDAFTFQWKKVLKQILINKLLGE